MEYRKVKTLKTLDTDNNYVSRDHPPRGLIGTTNKGLPLILFHYNGAF